MTWKESRSLGEKKKQDGDEKNLERSKCAHLVLWSCRRFQKQATYAFKKKEGENENITN